MSESLNKDMHKETLVSAWDKSTFSFGCPPIALTNMLATNLGQLVESESCHTVTSMDKYKRLSEVSGLSVSELLALFRRIRQAEIAPEEIRCTLNNQEVIRDHRQAAWDIVRGLGLLVAAVVLVLLAPDLTEAGKYIATACVIGGGLFILAGYKSRQRSNQRLSQARALRQALEGPDGYIWRFQTLLEHADADGPIQIYESLQRCCEASRRFSGVNSKEDLLEYWFWVAQVDSHFLLAEVGEHDALLDPHSETSHD